MSRKDVDINGKRFTLTTLGSYGFGIGVRPWRLPFDAKHFVIKTIHSKFDKELYSFPHTPILIDEVYDREKFSRKNALRVLDMPIKFAGSNEYRVPKELQQFDELIAKIVSFEHTVNPYVSDYYAYLTVDQSTVAENSFQRNPGCHVDGFQGARIKEKRPVNRSYIVYDATPTIFYPQSFKTDHLNEATDNFFFSFEEQSDETSAIHFLPYQILLMNAYTVHKSAISNHDTHRTFFRLSFDTMIFDRFGNTKNPMFDYNWQMITRDTQKYLVHKPIPKHHEHAY